MTCEECRKEIIDSLKLIAAGKRKLESAAALTGQSKRPVEDKHISIPLGLWDLNGNWQPNPLLKMSAAEQYAHNIKSGFQCKKDIDK